MPKLTFPKLLSACLAIGAITAFSAFGKLDEASEDALKKTKALLQNPEVLKGPAGNADEKAALAEVDKLFKGDPKGTQAVNGLSAQIFEDIVKKDGGDPAAIANTLATAQKDPKAFFQNLTPAQQEQIKALAKDLEAKK